MFHENDGNTLLGVNDEFDSLHTIRAIEKNWVDLLVVDHYGIDKRWEEKIRPYVSKIMVIDDLANRIHDCDILLDQNFYTNLAFRYQGLVPSKCKTFLGPGYVLLRPNFKRRRALLRARDGTIERILVFLGGSDPKNVTRDVLLAILELGLFDTSVDVVVGNTNPHKHSIQALCDQVPGATYYCDVKNLDELIANADLGVGAGGSAMWERCYLGLPTITVVTADNQLRTTEDTATLGAILYLGDAKKLSLIDYRVAISKLTKNPQSLRKVSEAALGLFQNEEEVSVAAELENLFRHSPSDTTGATLFHPQNFKAG
jgi:UDP-2,4-diacetamido-2,4,6-trideoxy-beta-L-altropyranose hydrolase